MLLKSLKIRRAESWENEKGFLGELETTSPTGEIKIRLSDESCRKILAVAANGIREAAGELSSFLKEEAASVLMLEGS